MIQFNKIFIQLENQGIGHNYAETFHEPDEIGRGQEKAQLRDEHNGAKECRGKSCQKNPTNKDGKKPKPVDLEHLY